MVMNDYCDATDGYMEDISKALATTASIFNYTYPSGSANDIIEEHSIISQKTKTSHTPNGVRTLKIQYFS